MRVNGISRGLALREGFQVIRRQLQGTGNTGIDVIALLEVNVFEKVSAHAACGMESPYMSMPARWGMVPSTGINRLRRYSSMLGSICGGTVEPMLTV